MPRSPFVALLIAAGACHGGPPPTAPLSNSRPAGVPVYAAEIVQATDGRSELAVKAPCRDDSCDRGPVDLGTGNAHLVGLVDLRGKATSFAPLTTSNEPGAGMHRSLPADARLPAAIVTISHHDAGGADRAQLEVVDLRREPPSLILVADVALRQADGGGFTTKQVDLVTSTVDAPLDISIAQVMVRGSNDLVAPSSEIVRHRFVLANGQYVRLE